MIDDIATLEVDVDGFKVTVSIKPKPGTTITTEDAETTEDADAILTSALPHFPHLIRFPEPLRLRR
jgi:hypothetical protein